METAPDFNQILCRENLGGFVTRPAAAMKSDSTPLYISKSQSAISNPRSEIVNPKSAIRNPKSTIQSRFVLFAVLLAVSPIVALAAPAPPARAPKVKEAEPSTMKRVVYYLPSRVADFLDIWRFNIGIGPGVGINLRPTKSLQVGIGAYASTRFGLRGRRTPFWEEDSFEYGFDGMYHEEGDTERGFYEFGGTIHFIMVGLDMAFDIEEAIDFAFGIFGSDPADDDFR